MNRKRKIDWPFIIAWSAMMIVGFSMWTYLIKWLCSL